MGINWLYNDTDFTEEMIGDNYGFVYCITNLTNDKKYIGKKFCSILIYFVKVEGFLNCESNVTLLFKIPSMCQARCFIVLNNDQLLNALLSLPICYLLTESGRFSNGQ